MDWSLKMKTSFFRTLFASVVLAAMAIGCAKSPGDSSTSAGPSPEGEAYLTSVEPQGALDVQEALAQAEDSKEVTVVGRIGGEVDPWVEGQAAFLLVDSSLKTCDEKGEHDCATPWDYCCDTDVLPKMKTMVKVVDDSGKTVATDARQLLGVKESQTLVVRGKAKKDEAGNLTVLASQVFVRK
jgi:hypothetical protein